MQLCAITDRRPSPIPAQYDAQHTEVALRQRLFERVGGWTAGGVHFIQLREKDLDAPALQSLAREIVAKIQGSHSKLLVNVSAPESAALAVAAGADGVHLAGKPTPGAARSVRKAFRCSGREAIVSVPCHSLEDVDVAVSEEVDLMLFSPVFEKRSRWSDDPEIFAAQGLEGLHQACAAARGIPVFALGGVTSGNAPECVAAGVAGVAGIRLFAGGDWRRLRVD